MSLSSDLKQLIKGDVYDDEAALSLASRDASLFEVKPQVVVAPRDAADLATLIHFAREHKTPITARSAGTGMDGGALTNSIVVDFTKYFAQVKEVTDMQAVTQPGVFYRDFEKKTLIRNRLMPSYPASRELCTVGGMTANNAGGEKTLEYGKVIDFVTGLKVVLADGNEYTLRPLSREELEAKKQESTFEGEVYRKMHELLLANHDRVKAARPRVSKNSAGYYLWEVWDPNASHAHSKEKGVFDLTKLFVGSQGTLGLISEITFRLVEPKPQSQMVIVFLDSLDNVGELVNAVLKHKPSTFESYDDKTLKLALRFSGEFIKRLGWKNIFTLIANGMPEALSIFRYGLPKLVLQITFDGDDKRMICKKALALKYELESRYKPRYMEVIKSVHEADEYWLVRRESFNLLRHKVKGMKTAPFIDDIVVPVETLPEFLPKLNRILDDYKDFMIHNIAGHIGNGNFHIIPLIDFTNEAARRIIPECAERVYDLVFEYDGSTTGEHNDGIMRTPFVARQFGEEVYRLFEETKKIFDPDNIFNPGKKVGGTLDDVRKYMKRTN